MEIICYLGWASISYNLAQRHGHSGPGRLSATDAAVGMQNVICSYAQCILEQKLSTATFESKMNF
jgi:hypothetical protein